MISLSQKLLAEHYLLRTFIRTICSSETAFLLKCKKLQSIPSENVSDYFSLVANLLGDALVKKYEAVWQRRTKLLRAAWLSRTHISWKIIFGCPWRWGRSAKQKLMGCIPWPGQLFGSQNKWGYMASTNAWAKIESQHLLFCCNMRCKYSQFSDNVSAP